MDTSTDLRAQALANDLRRVDAILFTHSHADHVFGLDEVRRYNVLQHDVMPCFANHQTAADLRDSVLHSSSSSAAISCGDQVRTPASVTASTSGSL